MSGLELSRDIFLLWLAFLKTQLVLWHSFVVHSTIHMDVCPHGWGSDRQGTRVERNKSGVVQDYTCIPAIAAKDFCVVKPCPELSWVNLRNDWGQKEISCLCGRGGNFSKGRDEVINSCRTQAAFCLCNISWLCYDSILIPVLCFASWSHVLCI